MQKTNKSYAKRIKVTPKGKLLSRKPGQNHFNAKESGRSKLHKRGKQSIVLPSKKANAIKRDFLPHSKNL